jgi:uncharacterized membrane protein (DUF4010 family)
MLPLPSFVPGMALALAIGLMIGFERGWQQRDEAPGQRVAGVRTFAMLALLGGLAGLATAGPVLWIALVASGGAALALLIAHALEMRLDRTVSATGAIAALTTMLLGSIASTGHHALAATAASALVALLAARKPLHLLLQQSSEEDMQALIRLALVIFLVLPLLPDAGLGPYGSLNPRRLWLVVVVIGAISFGGYVLTRLLGDRHGGLFAAGLGALVSSTAVTLACAHAIRRGEAGANQAGIALASAVMLVRTVVLVTLLAPQALHVVVLLVGPALLVSVIAAGILVWTTAASQGAAARATHRPPGLATALLFAALVAAVTLAAAWLEHHVGRGGAAAAVVFGGMVDVDSAIAAIGGLPADALSPRLAALAIAAPVAFNTLLKLGLTLGIAGRRAARWAAVALLMPALTIAAGAAVVLT